MRTIFSLLSLALLLAVTGCGKPTTKVDASYKTAAEEFRQQIITALQDPATQSTILQKTHEAEEAFEKASVQADEQAGKKHPVTPYLSGKVVLSTISTSPVDLRKDGGDSSAPYKAKVVLTFTTVGQDDSLNVEMPVTADQAGKWTFPETADAINLTKEQFDTPAQALLDQAKL